MSEGGLDSYLSAWREADPQRAYAWLFLRPLERIRFGACAALVQEWCRILREVREPQVAVTKLAWWREELQRAAAGEARHPLTQVLFADARIRALPLSCWSAVVDAALAMLATPPCSDFIAQRQQIGPLATAIAKLQSAVWFGPDADSTRAAAVTAIAMLLADVKAIGMQADQERSPLPMNLMARHGLTPAALAVDGAARSAALRDYAAWLREPLVDAATMAGPLTLFREAALRHDLRSLDRAVDAEDPLATLRAPATGFGNLLKTWRAARRWRRMSDDETQP